MRQWKANERCTFPEAMQPSDECIVGWWSCSCSLDLCPFPWMWGPEATSSFVLKTSLLNFFTKKFIASIHSLREEGNRSMESLLDNSYDRATTPLSWPHGMLTSCRVVLLMDTFLARFARTFSGPSSLELNTAEHVFILLLLLLLLAEAVYSWLYIHRNFQVWTKMLLFYPVHFVVLFVNALCLINLLNDYGSMAALFSMGWPIFWASLEMLCSLLIPALCGLHLCVGKTFEQALTEFRQLVAKSADIVSRRAHIGQPIRRSEYEDIQ